MTHFSAGSIIALYERHAEAWGKLRSTDLFEVGQVFEFSASHR
ncbi:hypothetical protein JOE25_001355 [Serratia sp. PL17]|nr:hypothetical protein [Serratia sp. PL17]